MNNLLLRYLTFHKRVAISGGIIGGIYGCYTNATEHTKNLSPMADIVERTFNVTFGTLGYAGLGFSLGFLYPVSVPIAINRVLNK